MSPELGNVDLASNHNTLSADTKRVIESEVRRLIEQGRVRATKLIESKRKELDYLAQALLDYETLTKEEAYKVIKGEKLERKMLSPNGSIKIPSVGGLGGDVGSNALPPIPGSEPDKTNDKEPPRPSGGAIA